MAGSRGPVNNLGGLRSVFSVFVFVAWAFALVASSSEEATQFLLENSDSDEGAAAAEPSPLPPARGSGEATSLVPSWAPSEERGMPETGEEPTKPVSRERSGTWSPEASTTSRSRTWTFPSSRGSRRDRKRDPQLETDAIMRRASFYGSSSSRPVLRDVTSSLGKIQFDEGFVTVTAPSSSSKPVSMKRGALCRSRGSGSESNLPIDVIESWEEAIKNVRLPTPESSSAGSAPRHFPAGGRIRRNTTSSSSTGADELEQEAAGRHGGTQASSEDGETSTRRRRERRLTEGEGDEKAAVTTRRRSLSGSFSSGKSSTTHPLLRSVSLRHKTSGPFAVPTEKDLFRLTTLVSPSQHDLLAATLEESSQIKHQFDLRRQMTTYYVVTPYSEDTAIFRKASPKPFELFFIDEKIQKRVLGLFCGLRKGQKLTKNCIDAINSLYKSCIESSPKKGILVIQIPWYQLEELLQAIDNKFINGYTYIFLTCVKPSVFDPRNSTCFGDIHVSFDPFSLSNYFVINGLVIKQLEEKTVRIFSSVLIQIPPLSCISVDKGNIINVPSEGYGLWHGSQGIFLVTKDAKAHDLLQNEKTELKKWQVRNVTDFMTALLTNPSGEVSIPLGSQEIKMPLDTDVLFFRMELLLPFKPNKPPTVERTYVIKLFTGRKQEPGIDIRFVDEAKTESLITYSCAIPSSGSDYSSTGACIREIKGALSSHKVLFYVVSENREAVEWVCRDLFDMKKIKEYSQLKVLLIIRKKYPDPWSLFFRNDFGETRENPTSLAFWYTHPLIKGGIVHIEGTPCYGSAVFRYDAASYALRISSGEDIELPTTGKLEVTWTLTKVHVRERKQWRRWFKKKQEGKNILSHVKENRFEFVPTKESRSASFLIFCDDKPVEGLKPPLHIELKEVEIRGTEKPDL